MSTKCLFRRFHEKIVHLNRESAEIGSFGKQSANLGRNKQIVYFAGEFVKNPFSLFVVVSVWENRIGRTMTNFQKATSKHLAVAVFR